MERRGEQINEETEKFPDGQENVAETEFVGFEEKEIGGEEIKETLDRAETAVSHFASAGDAEARQIAEHLGGEVDDAAKEELAFLSAEADFAKEKLISATSAEVNENKDVSESGKTGRKFEVIYEEKSIDNLLQEWKVELGEKSEKCVRIQEYINEKGELLFRAAIRMDDESDLPGMYLDSPVRKLKQMYLESSKDPNKTANVLASVGTAGVEIYLSQERQNNYAYSRDERVVMAPPQEGGVDAGVLFHELGHAAQCAENPEFFNNTRLPAKESYSMLMDTVSNPDVLASYEEVLNKKDALDKEQVNLQTEYSDLVREQKMIATDCVVFALQNIGFGKEQRGELLAEVEEKRSQLQKTYAEPKKYWEITKEVAEFLHEKGFLFLEDIKPETRSYHDQMLKRENGEGDYSMLSKSAGTGLLQMLERFEETGISDDLKFRNLDEDTVELGIPLVSQGRINAEYMAFVVLNRKDIVGKLEEFEKISAKIEANAKTQNKVFSEILKSSDDIEPLDRLPESIAERDATLRAYTWMRGFKKDGFDFFAAQSSKESVFRNFNTKPKENLGDALKSYGASTPEMRKRYGKIPRVKKPDIKSP